MNALLTFLEGAASFFSPCVLPLLPVYVAYFAANGARPAQAFARAVSFVLGFTLVFVALGVFAGSLGAALSAHRTAVTVVCGAAVVLFGLGYLGVLRLPFGGLKTGWRPNGVLSAFVFGLVFSVGLTPCVGAFLAAALLQAAAAGGALRGAALLLAYSAGLGVPFVLSAVFLSRFSAALGFLRGHMSALTRFCGGFLVLFGLWMAGGALLPSFAATSGAAPASNAEAKTTTKIETKADSSASAATPPEGPLEVTVTAANFEAEVLKAKGPVLVDFWAPWCGPCRRLGPLVAELAKAKRGALKVCKVNVDDAQELAGRYGISGIPTLILFRDGQVVRRSVGLLPRERLFGFVDGESFGVK